MNKNRDFDFIKINLASPECIRNWSRRQLPSGEIIGEVTRSTTLNYKTYKPEAGGLLCEKIFGPTVSWTCCCGRYPKTTYKKKKTTKILCCEECGVELTDSRVRRHRMGFINLAFPMTHIWYLFGSPSYIARVLNISLKQIKKIIYFENDIEEKKRKLPKKTEKTKKKQQQLKDEVDQYLKKLEKLNKILEQEWLKKLEADEIDKLNKIKFSTKLENLEEIKFKQENNQTISDFFLEKESFQKKYSKKQEQIKEEDDEFQDNFEDFDKYMKIVDIQKLGSDLTTKQVKNFVYASHKQGSYQILLMLHNIYKNLDSEIKSSRNDLANWKYDIYQKPDEDQQILKRIRILENFKSSESNPAWMVLQVLPVLPPGLRPLIELESGLLVTSDLNDHYRRVITRNNRLKKLLRQVRRGEILFDSEHHRERIENDRRLLQEAIDSLIDNGKKGTKIYTVNDRPLKSLAEIISGKEGRFRQNLLGKRVDFSGRSVIVVGPDLKLNQCGLPYEIAIELFRPFILSYLVKSNLVSNLNQARITLEEKGDAIWLILEKITKAHPILLNRAPTLHRLGVQAFEPKIIKGRAIQLHPLVCSAFNADFDGDQMAVHIPISKKAQMEAKSLMSIFSNFLSSATCRPIFSPTQDMVLGCYYLTTSTVKNLQGQNNYFSSFSEILKNYNQGNLELHTPVWLAYLGPVEGNAKKFNIFKTLLDNTKLEKSQNIQQRKSKDGAILSRYIRTTPGKLLLNKEIARANKLKLKKKSKQVEKIKNLKKLASSLRKEKESELKIKEQKPIKKKKTNLQND